jgi:hypothetical protein
MYSVGYIMEFLMLQDSGMTWILYLRSTSHWILNARSSVTIENRTSSYAISDWEWSHKKKSLSKYSDKVMNFPCTVDW